MIARATDDGLPEGQRFVVLIVNYRTPQLTLRAVASCMAAGLTNILVVDNGSDGDAALLRSRLAEGPATVQLHVLERNVGFAGGVNAGVALLEGDPAWTHLLLLNSDAEVVPSLGLRLALCPAEHLQVAGGRIDQPLPDGSAQIESMGMTLHRSLVASERTNASTPLLGPTGAFMVLSRTVLRDVISLHGSLFADDFFCYAEDTDLCVRLRLLGHRPALIPDGSVASHRGQASSGGKGSDFIFFHGIRNTLWMQLRCVPMRVLLRCSPWMVLFHLLLAAKSVRERRLRILWNIYLETAKALPRLLRERWRIRRTRRLAPSAFRPLLARSFYDKAYIAAGMQALLPPPVARLAVRMLGTAPGTARDPASSTDGH